ncbi:MAG: dTMP kinase [Acidimicrobiales bacterium]
MAEGSGWLIAIEGGEGAGKSTQAALLAHSLGAGLSREPGGTRLGEQIRELLLGPSFAPIADRAELLLMLAARAQHLKELIQPALLAGQHVVVDRFSGSTVAYQGYGRGLALRDVRAACDLATGGRWPDVNVLIDVPVSLGATRRAGSTGLDRIEAETTAFHERVRQGFLTEASADPQRWCVIDGQGPAETVAVSIRAAVQEKLDAQLGLSM